MGEPLEVVVFCEDVAQERFVHALTQRLAREERRPIALRNISARGGHGKAMSELRAFQRLRQVQVLVVAIDGNCKGREARRNIEGAIDGQQCAASAIACPDPHIERWYLADPVAFKRELGVSVTLPKTKCDRDFYKNALTAALVEAGHTVTLGGAEFAPEIVNAMDLYRAGKNAPELGSFVDDMRRALRRLKGAT